MKRREQPAEPELRDNAETPRCELKLLVPADLYRAWQRCSWLLVHETGRTRTDLMEEMVDDFLRKHGC